jgi:5-formyltetrahydrofolate cyclo-ligase
MPSKAELRQALLPRLKATNATERTLASEQLCARLVHNPLVSAAPALALYAAWGWELDLTALAEVSLSRGARLLYPRWTPKGYEMVPISSLTDLIPGKHGIHEPRKDLAATTDTWELTWIVPGLAFSSEGARLGRGAGDYDRLLADASGPRIGVCRDWQLQPHLPQGPFDILMTHVATDKRWLTCPTPILKGIHQ